MAPVYDGTILYNFCGILLCTIILTTIGLGLFITHRWSQQSRREEEIERQLMILEYLEKQGSQGDDPEGSDPASP